MLTVAPEVKVYLAVGATDMRKSINGLSLLVEEHFQLDLFSGSLFAFCNRNKDRVKILYWDRNGFCLWHKRLERDRFHWPDSASAARLLSVRELRWLLDGLSIDQAAHRVLRYGKIS